MPGSDHFNDHVGLAVPARAYDDAFLRPFHVSIGLSRVSQHFVFHGLTQDFANLLLKSAAMPARHLPQRLQHLILKVANDQLSHDMSSYHFRVICKRWQQDYASHKSVLRFFRPESQMITAITLPRFRLRKEVERRAAMLAPPE